METKSLYIACLSLSTSVDKMETKPIDKSRAVRQTKTVRNRIMRFWIPVCYLRIVISFPFVICQFDLSRVINTNGSDRTNRFCLLSVSSICPEPSTQTDQTEQTASVCYPSIRSTITYQTTMTSTLDDFRLTTSHIRTI